MEVAFERTTSTPYKLVYFNVDNFQMSTVECLLVTACDLYGVSLADQNCFKRKQLAFYRGDRRFQFEILWEFQWFWLEI